MTIYISAFLILLIIATLIHQRKIKKEIQKTGEDFIKTLGYNPFPHSLKLNINSDYANEEKMQELEKSLSQSHTGS